VSRAGGIPGLWAGEEVKVSPRHPSLRHPSLRHPRVAPTPVLLRSVPRVGSGGWCLGLARVLGRLGSAWVAGPTGSRG